MGPWKAETYLKSLRARAGNLGRFPAIAKLQNDWKLATFVPFGRFETSAPVALNSGDPSFFCDVLISRGHEPRKS